MNNISKGLLIISLSLGLLGATTASASSREYSTQRANSVRLVWRANMGRHALVASKGARYSEHLGIRYGLNADTSDVVWYTNAHEELYDKDTGNYLIYYHVNNASYSSGGWIWRGYLQNTNIRRGSTVKASSGENGSTTPIDSGTESSPTSQNDDFKPATVPVSQMNWQAAKISDSSLADDDISAISEFSNSNFDARLEQAVDNFVGTGMEATMNDPAPYQQQRDIAYLNSFVSVKQYKLIRFVAKNPDSPASVSQGLTDVGYSPETCSQYSEWYVAGEVAPLDAYYEGESDPGTGYILLVQES